MLCFTAKLLPASSVAVHTTELTPIAAEEDSGSKTRLRCAACGYTHWNNPTPVLAAVVEYQGKILLAQNAAWPGKMFALITGFMEAGETPQQRTFATARTAQQAEQFAVSDVEADAIDGSKIAETFDDLVNP